MRAVMVKPMEAERSMSNDTKGRVEALLGASMRLIAGAMIDCCLLVETKSTHLA